MAGVMCQYANCTAIFSFAGLDKQDNVIYAISHTTGKWSRGVLPHKAMCAVCAAEMPLWMLNYNRYIAATFKV
jgi:hypothetical protein